MTSKATAPLGTDATETPSRKMSHSSGETLHCVNREVAETMNKAHFGEQSNELVLTGAPQVILPSPVAGILFIAPARAMVFDPPAIGFDAGRDLDTGTERLISTHEMRSAE